MSVTGDSLPWAATALAVGLLGGGLWLCVRGWSRIQHIQDTPTSKIRSAAQGYVELVGRLLPPNSLQAPLSGQACQWWRYRIEELHASGKNRTSEWRTLEKAVSTQWLRLGDGTGECLINPQGAHVLTRFKRVWYGHKSHPCASDQPQVWWRRSRRYRYTEEWLLAGDPLYALGAFMTRGGGREVEDVQALQKQLLREWKQDFPALLARFDRDGDGQFSEQEWLAVQQAARETVERQQERIREQPELNLMCKSARQPFVLSNLEQKDIVQRFRWLVAGGITLCLLGVLLLAKCLGVY